MYIYAFLTLTFMSISAADATKKTPDIWASSEKYIIDVITYNIGVHSSHAAPYDSNIRNFTLFDGSTNTVFLSTHAKPLPPQDTSTHENNKAYNALTFDSKGTHEALVTKKYLHGTTPLNSKRHSLEEQEMITYLPHEGQNIIKSVVIDQNENQELIICDLSPKKRNIALCIKPKNSDAITEIYPFKINDYPLPSLGTSYSKETKTIPCQDNNWIYDPATRKLFSYYKFFNHIAPFPTVEIITIHGFDK